MVIVIVFVLGLIVGSFLNVVIFRINDGKSFLFGRSKCFHCGKELKPLDLVPLLSFVLLKGRCRYCKNKISWQYPMVELLTGLVFVLLSLGNMEYGIWNMEFWFQLIFSCFFIIIAVYDYKHYLILDKVVLPASLVALVYQISQNNLFWSLLGALIISGFFALQYFASKGRWIGFGDVKLGIFLGLFFAQASLWFLIFAYFAGAIAAILLVIFFGKKFGSKVPFGTILGFCAIMFMLWGDQLVHWYLRLIGI